MDASVEPQMELTIPRTLITGTVLAVISVVVFFMSGFGYNWDIWSLGTAFQMFKWGAVGALAGLLLTVIGSAVANFSSSFQIASMSWIGIILSIIVVGTAVYFIIRARTVPSIHDITTDTAEPPEFIALRDLRERAPNEVEYAGEEVAKQQLANYPDIKPMFLDMSEAEAFDKALESARAMNWEIHAVDTAEHRIEATHQIMWFGFKDDVVIRVRHDSTRSRVRIDMRSASRIGKSDVGENARRIKRYMKVLRSKVKQE